MAFSQLPRGAQGLRIILKTMNSKPRWKKYRKKPIVIEAYQAMKPDIIETLEGSMRVDAGDYVIKGIKGELYPCKLDIFMATYEEIKEEEIW